jgi:integrase
MTLFKRGHVWWTGFYVDGKRYQESTGTNNRRRAESIERKLKEEKNLGRFRLREENPDLTFGELAKEFKENADISLFHTGRLKFLEAFFGEMRVVTITKHTTEEYRKSRKEADPDLKDATLNRDIAVLRRVFNWALDREIILVNPLIRVPMVRERRVKKPIVSLPHEELILAHAKPHLKALVIAALDTGMRRGELFRQIWKDVDCAGGLLYVTQSKTAEGEGRTIPLTRRLKSLLKEKHASREDPTGPIFRFQGHPIGDLKRSWATAQKDADLPVRYRFHDLRHTFNTRLMEAGVIQDVRMALMGHEPRSVHWGYTHVELPALRQGIQKLEAWMGKQRKSKRKS